MGLKNLEKVHLIGHSLGAHLRWVERQLYWNINWKLFAFSGYAGYHLQRDFKLKVERITALDRKFLIVTRDIGDLLNIDNPSV